MAITLARGARLDHDLTSPRVIPAGIAVSESAHRPSSRAWKRSRSL